MLPLRPSCQPLIAQAADAVFEIATLALAPDGPRSRALISSAHARLVEALRRTMALHPPGVPAPDLWRHRVSSRLAFEIAERKNHKALPPASLGTASLAAPTVLPDTCKDGCMQLGGSGDGLRAVGQQVVEGFGGVERRPKATEILAAEAFEEAGLRVPPSQMDQAAERNPGSHPPLLPYSGPSAGASPGVTIDAARHGREAASVQSTSLNSSEVEVCTDGLRVDLCGC